MSLKIDLSINDFYKSPNDYVLCLEQQGDGKEKVLKAEQKGCWTWIKANLLYWLYPETYQLIKIAAELQHNSSEMPMRLADLMLGKITKYNLNHKDDPIKKDFFRNFIKEKDVTRGLSPKDPSLHSDKVEEAKITVENFIHSLIKEHLQKLTPETVHLPRGSLVNALIPKLQEEYPSHSLDKKEIRKIALNKYCYIVACNFNTGRTDPLDPDTDDLVECLERLKQAMKIDFSELRLKDHLMITLGKQAFRKIQLEHLLTK